MLTIFTCPKPFHGHINIIQRNALQSWLALGERVQVLLIGDEEGMAEVAQEFGVQHVRDVARNELGTPRLDSIFAKAREHASHDILCYVNADVMLMQDLLPAVERVQLAVDDFLIMGQRWDLDVGEEIAFSPNWETEFRERIRKTGKLHPPAGSDCFIYPKGLFRRMPAFALGRSGWDNWMIFAGRHWRIPVIDATPVITIVHQSHDYGHLPEGQSHYRLPESTENIKLAGGRVTMFILSESNWLLTKSGLSRKPIPWKKPGRWIETSLIALIGGGKKGKLVGLLLHPVSTMKYYCSQLLGKIRKSNGRRS